METQRQPAHGKVQRGNMEPGIRSSGRRQRLDVNRVHNSNELLSIRRIHKARKRDEKKTYYVVKNQSL